MPCSCDVSPIPFSVPPTLRECTPAGSDAAKICPRCLAVSPADDGPADPDFARVIEAFPDGEGGIALALALGLLESLATNRAAIETALERTERAGADPLLVLDRLLADTTVEPAIDLERRRHQVEQLLY